MLKQVALIIIWLGVAPLCLRAQVGLTKVAPDSRVERILTEAKLNYTVDSDGDFKLYTQLKDGRLQTVWIISETQLVGSLEVRQVWSLGYASDSPLPEPILRELLEQNARVKLGAWQIRKMSGKYVAVFAVQVGANIDKTNLLQILSAVASTADDLEKSLSDKDIF